MGDQRHYTQEKSAAKLKSAFVAMVVKLNAKLMACVAEPGVDTLGRFGQHTER